MDLLKLSVEWAKAEIFSAKIVWLFSIVVLLGASGFALWGRTAMAKAFVVPLLVSALFLIAVGAGLFMANKPRIAQFEKEYHLDADSFLKKEIERTAKSEEDFKLIFKILPSVIIVAAILLMILSSPNWRAISITLILLSVFLMAVDSNTSARNAAYRQQLVKALS